MRTNKIHSPQHPILTHPFFYLSLASSTCSCRCRGLFLHLVTLKDTHTHTHTHLVDSSGRVISLTHRPLPDNKKHTKQTSMPWVGFEPAIPGSARPLYIPSVYQNYRLLASNVVLSGRNIPTLKTSHSRQQQYSQEALKFSVNDAKYVRFVMYLPQPQCMDRIQVLHQPSFGPRLSKIRSLQFVTVRAKKSWSG